MDTIDGEPPRANSLRNGPDEDGRFGIFGGRFVAETLMPLIRDLEAAYLTAKDDPAFIAEMADPADALCRPPVAALFRRAPHASTSAARRSSSSAKS